MDRYVRFSLSDDKSLNNLGYCFTSTLRRRILAAVSQNSYTILELAYKFNVPLSTMSTNIKMLYDGGLITLTSNPKKRGNEKVVSLSTTFLHIDLSYQNEIQQNNVYIFDLPLGSFTDFVIHKPCGMANEKGLILEDDNPDVFLSPNRVQAQILWFSSGDITYQIPNYKFKDAEIKSISFTLELCSECPNYRNDWKSNVTFWLNGVEAAMYLSPGDFGGRRGNLNPEYWSATATQYGLLKTFKVTQDGTYIDESRVSDVTLSDVDLFADRVFRFKIGVKENAKYKGGINIFGERFGDYPQNITVKVEYV